LSSAWLAQELLTTFEKEIGEVSLRPNNEKPGGKFLITVDGDVIWDRKSSSTPGFPEAKELKQLVRDKVL
jgi:selenoprotein W-related protein